MKYIALVLIIFITPVAALAVTAEKFGPSDIPSNIKSIGDITQGKKFGDWMYGTNSDSVSGLSFLGIGTGNKKYNDSSILTVHCYPKISSKGIEIIMTPKTRIGVSYYNGPTWLLARFDFEAQPRRINSTYSDAMVPLVIGKGFQKWINSAKKGSYYYTSHRGGNTYGEAGKFSLSGFSAAYDHLKSRCRRYGFAKFNSSFR